MTLTVRDHFMENVCEIRARALAASYSDTEGLEGGQIYKRVCVCVIPELTGAIEALLNKSIDVRLQLFRLNYDGEIPNSDVHCDPSYGAFIGIYYLTLDEHAVGGTALWRHKQRHVSQATLHDAELIRAIESDWNTPAAWEMHAYVAMRYNRFVCFPASWFHSRFPAPAFGASPENGRLIAVTFWN